MRTLSQQTIFLSCALIALTFGAMGTLAIKAPHAINAMLEQVARLPAMSTADLLAEAGVRTRDITVSGRTRTNLADLQQAVDVDAGVPLMALDMLALRERIEALPWVAHADVTRRLPSGLHITLTERHAVAIWQRPNSDSMLIDASGAEIGPVIAEFADLLVITGPEASAGIASLLGILDQAHAAGLSLPVAGATRFGTRRWDLYLGSLTDGLQVRLPAADTPAALTRLKSLLNETPGLAENARLLDMRLKQRVIMRLRDPAIAPPIRTARKGVST